jgi:hypothetical protein
VQSAQSVVKKLFHEHHAGSETKMRMETNFLSRAERVLGAPERAQMGHEQQFLTFARAGAKH